MELELYKRFTFEAAHFLPNVPSGHISSKIHGHSYRLTVYIGGKINEKAGWMIDICVFEEKCQMVVSELDHSFLNEIDGLSNPTIENIAKWVWIKLFPHFPNLNRIEINGAEAAGCIYRGDVSP